MRPWRDTAPGLAAALLLACAGAPTALYPGPERPDAEVALLRESHPARVLRVDGERVAGQAWTLLPGPHEVWLHVHLYTQEPNVGWNVWSYCRVPFEASAGERYTTRVRTVKERESVLASRMKMEVGLVDAAETLQAVPVSCTGERPDFDAD